MAWQSQSRLVYWWPHIHAAYFMEPLPKLFREPCMPVQAKHTRPEVRLWLLTTITQLAGRTAVASTKAKLVALATQEAENRGDVGAASACLQELLALYAEDEPLEVQCRACTLPSSVQAAQG